jgi:hypothetical protein
MGAWLHPNLDRQDRGSDLFSPPETASVFPRFAVAAFVIASHTGVNVFLSDPAAAPYCSGVFHGHPLCELMASRSGPMRGV